MKAEVINESEANKLLNTKELFCSDKFHTIYIKNYDEKMVYPFNLNYTSNNALDILIQARKAALLLAPSKWTLFEISPVNEFSEIEEEEFRFLFHLDSSFKFGISDGILIKYEYGDYPIQHLSTIIYYALICESFIDVVTDNCKKGQCITLRDGQLAYYNFDRSEIYNK